MDCKEFVVKIKQYAVDETVRSTVSQLEAPQLMLVKSNTGDVVADSMNNFMRARNSQMERESAWFAKLTPEDRLTFHSIVQRCSERTLFEAFCFLDGVGGDTEGVFEVTECIAGQRKNVLNPENTDMLHDLLSDVCERNRRGE